MAYDDTGDLGRALAALDIFTVWAAAYREGAALVPAPQRDGVTKSPFREDGTKGSFSVIGGGKGFKDHGGDGASGAVWKFCQLCWPGDSKAETARRVIALSGITPTERKPGVGFQSSAKVDWKAKIAAAADAVYAEREKKLLPPKFKPVAVWPECVAKRWAEGIDALAADDERQADIAQARGWPVGWVDDLVVMGKLACPWDRGATPGAKYAARQRAFIVEQPRFEAGGLVLDRVGYHQHWFMAAKDGKPAAKGWLYVPSTPKRFPRGDFERELLAYAAANGSTQESPRSLVPALPFVLGDLVNTRLIVILEGQWDAITFFGACGFLENERTFGEGRRAAIPDGIAVFGIRGAQGMDVFLGAWAQWLRRMRPRAWVIADNDAAGGTWRDQPEAEAGLPRPPSLGDRLIAAGCGGGEHDEARAPVVSWLKKGVWGKDFNDYFKGFTGGFGPDKIAAWMRARGLDYSKGGRA
jgi:hypothetical protein